MSAHETQVHVVGAGVSGLAAAVRMARRGRKVTLYDAAGHAGGRCRSFHDDVLDCEIDNGNHLLLSGNRSAMTYLDMIGARNTLLVAPQAAFPFVDVRDGARWRVAMNPGRLPIWMFRDDCRVPGTGPGDYLKALKLARAGERTVAEVLGPDGPAFERFWDPLAVSVLNTPSESAAASLLWPVLRETLGRGEAASRPCIAAKGLSESFVRPAIALLREKGAAIRFNTRLRGIGLDGTAMTNLRFAGETTVKLAPGDALVLAVPAPVAGQLLKIDVPEDHHPIVNAHFRLPEALDFDSTRFFLGVIGGTAHWLFMRGDIVSVTVSAADALSAVPAEEIAARLWRDIGAALDLPAEPMPPVRVVKEKRATFAQTPAALKRRPDTRTRWTNLVLAGDWTDTGLPATIEGSIRSGFRAAAALGS